MVIGCLMDNHNALSVVSETPQEALWEIRSFPKTELIDLDIQRDVHRPG
jgi:hypothetical protein